MGVSSGTPGVAVALIDGPIATEHPDLSREGIRVLSEHSSAPCASAQSVACAHGTYVAGVLHARRDSLAPGICAGCTLLVRPIFPVTAVGSEAAGVPNATMEELAAAIIEVIDAGARVINLSLGLAAPSSRSEHYMDQVLNQAARRDVIVVAAAGNQGALGGSTITRHPWVIPVVACDRQGRALAVSNLGASIGRNGLMAPGQDIESLAVTGGRATFTGSSAAVPFVSGAVALLWSIFPSVRATELRLAIAGGMTGRRSVTPPLLDAWGAYHALKAGAFRARTR